MERRRPGVLLDRDGTLIEERNYLADPEGVCLLPGAAAAVARWNAAGVPVGMVTNQSGVARGYFDEAAIAAVHARLDALLAGEGARLDGVWYCPHHPDHGDPCECRKPAPALAERAAEALGLDLARSWVIGDKRCDVELGARVGARGVLVETGHGARERVGVPPGTPVYPDLAAACDAWFGQEAA